MTDAGPAWLDLFTRAGPAALTGPGARSEIDSGGP